MKRNSRKESTWQKYKLQFGHFEAWCVQEGLPALPADAYTVEIYLTIVASTKQSTSTVDGAKAAIAAYHSLNKFPDPTKHEDVKALTKGTTRVYGQPSTQVKGMTREILQCMLVHWLGPNLAHGSAKDWRSAWVELLFFHTSAR